MCVVLKVVWGSLISKCKLAVHNGTHCRRVSWSNGISVMGMDRAGKSLAMYANIVYYSLYLEL